MDTFPFPFSANQVQIVWAKATAVLKAGRGDGPGDSICDGGGPPTVPGIIVINFQRDGATLRRRMEALTNSVGCSWVSLCSAASFGCSPKAARWAWRA